MFFANEQRDKVREDNPGIKFGKSMISNKPKQLNANHVQARLASSSVRSGRLSLRSSALPTRPRPPPTRSVTRRRRPPTR
jgi:hypothetical protein